MAIIQLAVLLSLHALSIRAIDLGAPIVGCSEVDCPTDGSSTSAACRVVDRTLSLIGLADLNTSVADFTWTEGIQVYDNVNLKVGGDRVYGKSFYLGAPQGFDLVKNASASNFGACALFFTNVTKSVRFDGGNVETAVGTCSDALSSDCVNALLKQATNVVSERPTSEMCEMLLSEFTTNLVPQCSRFATSDKWQGLKVQDLTGSTAPKPFTEAENSTSNCYPTLPKSNSLTRVASFNTSGTALAESAAENINSITPVLTLIFPQNGSSSAVLKEPEAQLTCLKGTGLTDAQTATLMEGPANILKSSKLTILGLSMISLWILA